MSFNDIESVSTTAKNFIDIAERIMNLPINERKHYRTVLSKTYRLFDNALLIPITRLSKMLTIPPDNKSAFINELRRLENFKVYFYYVKDSMKLNRFTC